MEELLDQVPANEVAGNEVAANELTAKTTEKGSLIILLRDAQQSEEVDVVLTSVSQFRPYDKVKKVFLPIVPGQEQSKIEFTVGGSKKTAIVFDTAFSGGIKPIIGMHGIPARLSIVEKIVSDTIYYNVTSIAYDASNLHDNSLRLIIAERNRRNVNLALD